MWSRANRVQQNLLQIRLFPKGPIGVDVDFVCAGPPGVCSAGLCCYEFNMFVLCRLYCDHNRLEMHKHKMLYNYTYIYKYICVFQLFSSTCSNQKQPGKRIAFVLLVFPTLLYFSSGNIIILPTTTSNQSGPFIMGTARVECKAGAFALGWLVNRVAWVTHGFIVPRL